MAPLPSSATPTEGRPLKLAVCELIQERLDGRLRVEVADVVDADVELVALVEERVAASSSLWE